MNHNKIIMGLLMFSGVFLLTACSQKEKDSTEGTSISSVAAGQAVQAELPDGLEIVRDSSLFQPVAEDQGYHFDTDHQYGIPQDYAVAETEDAWYVSEHYNLLYIWDKASKTYAPLCSKPDCKHMLGSTACDAFIGDAWELYYYDGSLYTVVIESDVNDENQSGQKLVLKKLSLDGTTREDVCTIAQCYVGEDSAYDDNVFSVRGIVHRGYLYYSYNFGTGGGNLDVDYYNNGSNILYRIKLDGSEKPQCIMVLRECGCPQTMCMRGAGSYIYFIDTGWDFYGNLYRLNTESMQIEEMDIGEIYSENYTVIGNKIIYKEKSDDTILYSYLPETGEKDVFADLGGHGENLSCGGFQADSANIYVFFFSSYDSDYWKVEVLDMQGNKTGEFSFYNREEEADQWVKPYAGMGDFFLCSTGNEVRTIYYLDKTKIQEGSAVFVEGNQ